MKIPTTKKLKKVLLETDCSKFGTLLKLKKGLGVTLEIDDLWKIIDQHLTDMAKDVRKFLVNEEKK